MPASPRKRLSQRPFVEELPEILKAKGLSIRAVARRAGVDPGHLNRVLRRTGYKTPSANLCERVAMALELPPDYWPEYRQQAVISHVRSDPELREALYRRLTSRKLRHS